VQFCTVPGSNQFVSFSSSHRTHEHAQPESVAAEILTCDHEIDRPSSDVS
jgi:hypothetical protein